MRKFLMAVAVLAVAACGGADEMEDAPIDSTPPMVTEPTVTVPDTTIMVDSLGNPIDTVVDTTTAM